MNEMERLTRRKANANMGRRGKIDTDYTSDATRQELIVRLAGYENAETLGDAEAIAATRDGGHRARMEALDREDADMLEACHTGRASIPLACARCNCYPDPMMKQAYCADARRVVRRNQYCGSFVLRVSKKAEG